MGLTSRHMALVLGIAAIAAAGCGSSSTSKSANTPAAPSTPATPSTTTTGTAPSVLERPKLPADTSVTSSTYKNAYVQALVKAGLSSSVATKLVDCIAPKLESAGIKTVGEVSGKQAEFKTVVQACAKQVAGA